MTAIEHALRTDVTRALRFCAALYRWWAARGRFAEAELIHARVREAGGDREPGLRARALHGRAFLAVWAGDFAAADAYATEALGLAEQAGDDTTAARARCQLGAALQFADPRASRAELARASALARRAGDDWALGTAKWLTVGTYMWQSDHACAARANAELAELAMRQGDPMQIARHWLYVAWMACLDGRFPEARQATPRLRAVVESVGEPVMEALADHFVAFADVWQGEPARALGHQPASLERAFALGVGSVVPWLIYDVAFAELALGRPEHARDALREMLSLVEGRHRLRHGVGAVPARRDGAAARRRRRRGHGNARADHRRAARQSTPRDVQRASPKAAWPPRAAIGRSPNSTRWRTSTPAPRAATRPTSRRVWTHSRKSPPAFTATSTRRGCSPPRSAPGNRSAPSASPRKTGTGPRSTAGYETRCPTAPTRRHAPRAPN